MSSVSSKEEVRLMHQAASGNQEALAALYDRYAPKLLGIGICILKNQAESEDLLHDVFIEAWRRAPEFDSRKGSVRAWFYRLMRSRALDRAKSARLSKRADPPEALESQRTHPTAEASAELGWLSGTLEDLPAAQRKALIMGYVEGFSASEIAAKTNVPIGTVKSRQAAALKKIREQTRGAS